MRFQSAAEAEAFCKSGMEASGADAADRSRVGYVSDYLYGFDPNADENGYARLGADGLPINPDERWFGVWIPGTEHSDTSLHSRTLAAQLPLFPHVRVQCNIAGSVIFTHRDKSKLHIFFVAGNGLNHDRQPNTVYRPAAGGIDEGIDLVALTQIRDGDQLFDDYKRHGAAPLWAKDFAR